MAKMGRPKIEIDKIQFEKLCQILCTLEDIAGFFDCSIDTIENWCKATYKLTFSDIYKRKAGKGKVSLRRKQFEGAMEGNTTLLIWLGKQALGQSDKREDKTETTVKILTESEADERLKQLIKEYETRNAHAIN